MEPDFPHDAPRRAPSASAIPYHRNARAAEAGIRAQRALREVLQQIALIVVLLIALTLIGVVGLRLTAGPALFDCRYLTVISLRTVVYSEVIPPRTAAQAILSSVCWSMERGWRGSTRNFIGFNRDDRRHPRFIFS